MELKVAYEDDSLLIAVKPSGLATTPGKRPSLCELVFSQRPGLAGVAGYQEGEGGLLNRLDHDTGGLVLFAQHNAAFRFYAGEAEAERLVKTYLAVVDGVPVEEAGVIEISVSHSRKSRRRMLVGNGAAQSRGRLLDARTAYRVVESRPPYSLLELEITRGRRHQIRVHLAARGWPIVGDRLYNKKASRLLAPHHLLFCSAVQFRALTGEEKSVTVAAPILAAWREMKEGR